MSITSKVTETSVKSLTCYNGRKTENAWNVYLNQHYSVFTGHFKNH